MTVEEFCFLNYKTRKLKIAVVQLNFINKASAVENVFLITNYFYFFAKTKALAKQQLATFQVSVK